MGPRPATRCKNNFLQPEEAQKENLTQGQKIKVLITKMVVFNKNVDRQNFANSEKKCRFALQRILMLLVHWLKLFDCLLRLTAAYSTEDFLNFIILANSFLLEFSKKSG